MSEERRWTPGPWVVGKGAGWFITRPDAAKRREAALAVGMTPVTSLVDASDGVASNEARANAHLMAAAPDLYEQLRQARGMLAACGFEAPEDNPELVASWNRQLATIDAALARARGDE